MRGRMRKCFIWTTAVFSATAKAVEVYRNLDFCKRKRNTFSSRRRKASNLWSMVLAVAVAVAVKASCKVRTQQTLALAPARRDAARGTN